MGDENLIKHATEYYKSLFGQQDRHDLKLDGLMGNRLNDEDVEMLLAPFDFEEIKEVVFSMKHFKAAGPDGLPVGFYQDFWEIIKLDLKEMFDVFHRGQLELES